MSFVKDLFKYRFNKIFYALLFCRLSCAYGEYSHFYQHLTWDVGNLPQSAAFHVDVRKNCAPTHGLTKEAFIVALQSVMQLCGEQHFCVTDQKKISASSDAVCSDNKFKSYVPLSNEQRVIEPKLCVELDHYTSQEIQHLEEYLSENQKMLRVREYGDVLQWRKNTFDALRKGNQEPLTWYYLIPDEISTCYESCPLVIGLLQSCQGDVFQQTIHHEFVSIAEKSVSSMRFFYSSELCNNAQAMIADFIEAGVLLNKGGSCSKALVLADACWAFLDCIQGIGEGLIEGMTAVVDDCIHPVRTIIDIVESAVTCGYYLGKVIVEVGELGYCAFLDRSAIHHKLCVWTDNYAIVSSAIKEKQKTLQTRDVIKEVTALGVQCYATSKILQGSGKLFNCAQKHATRIAKEIHSSADKAKLLTTPEGIIVRVANSATEYIKNAQAPIKKEILVVQNTYQFFELPFGQLLAKNSIKTPYRYQNPIYKLTKDIPNTRLKKGCFYYLDRLHLDHIEVFNSQHKVVAVYNLDGVFNEAKYARARGEKRNIDKLMKGKG